MDVNGGYKPTYNWWAPSCRQMMKKHLILGSPLIWSNSWVTHGCHFNAEQLCFSMNRAYPLSRYHVKFFGMFSFSQWTDRFNRYIPNDHQYINILRWSMVLTNMGKSQNLRSSGPQVEWFCFLLSHPSWGQPWSLTQVGHRKNDPWPLE